MSLEGTVEVSIDDAEKTREIFYQAMAEMTKLAPESFPSIDLDLGRGTIVVSFAVEVPELEGAVPPASTGIRTAFHAAGINTPGWPPVDHSCWQVQFISTRTAALV
ncbi:MAG: hypothetical protein AB7N61_18895 [Acidimicrobiia bacterium]